MISQGSGFGIVFTEGKTDWRHIKRANDVLRICDSVSFYEKDDTRGDSVLLSMCESLSRVPQEKPHIFVFDTDNKEIVRKAGAPKLYYKDWGNNVYSILLPTPPFRSGFQSLAIEMLYKDEDLTLSSPDNRRLFLSSEFNEASGNHDRLPLIHVGNVHRIRGLTKRSATVIIDSDIGVYDSSNNNLALSKAEFADLIYSQTGTFASIDFRGFRQLLLIIKGIAAKGQRDVEILTPEHKEKDINRIEIKRVHEARKDHPPYTPIFVGRETQIKKLDDKSLRVGAITGLGGEGKSTLASRFFRLALAEQTSTHFQKYGWCDCKELETTFHERLLVLIEELTGGTETRQKYSDESVNDTISRLISHLHQTDCLVVFDNVDAFVDRDSFSFIDSVRILFDEVTQKLSRGLVVFTCRAAIHDFHNSFLEIPIIGLSFSECRELAVNLNISIEEKTLREIYETTKGHALWLNLIFGQIRSGRISLDKIHGVLSRTSALSVDLDIRLLRSIWDNLSQKEKEIIWVISAFARPKDVDQIHRAAGIRYDKCAKVLRTLVSLRMVIEIDSATGTLFDLHPIIRAKAKEECGKSKRRSLATRVIMILTPGGAATLTVLLRSSKFSRASVEDYIESAEIAIEAGEVETAILYLTELAGNLWRVGEDTKFIDLAKRLLSIIDGKQARIGIDTRLTEVFEKFVTILLMQGDRETADRYLRWLQDSIESIKQFITYAELRGYYLWFTNDFNKAVTLLRDGIDEIRKKGEEVPADLRYYLALALRDSGEVDEAMVIFRKGREVDIIEKWDINSADANATDLGNIGRCLFLKGDYDKALILVGKSAKMLENGEARDDQVNLGYALLWIADIYAKKGEYDLAFSSIKQAVTVWKEYAPARLKKIRDHISLYPKKFLKKYANKLGISGDQS